MNYKLQEAEYNFHNVKFNCDDCLGSHIKAPFPNQSFFLCLIGRPGSGKTTLMIQMLTEKGSNRVYNKVFDKIMVVMPEKSRNSIKNNPFEKFPGDQLFEQFNSEVIEMIENNYKNHMEKEDPKTTFHQLLILDDITAHLKEKHIELMLKELSMNRRHLKLSIILLVQYLRSIPKPTRFQITDVVYFQPSNQLDADILNQEFIGMPKKKFDELKSFVWEDKYHFMFINKNTNTFFKNLQQIIFPSNETII